jgi:hypothetical protein
MRHAESPEISLCEFDGRGGWLTAFFVPLWTKYAIEINDRFAFDAEAKVPAR